MNPKPNPKPSYDHDFIKSTLHRQNQDFSTLQKRDLHLQSKIANLKSKLIINKDQTTTQNNARFAYQLDKTSQDPNKPFQNFTLRSYQCNKCAQYQHQIDTIKKIHLIEIQHKNQLIEKIKSEKLQRQKYLAKVLASSQVVVSQLNFKPQTQYESPLRVKSSKYKLYYDSAKKQKEELSLKKIEQQVQRLKEKEKNQRDILRQLTIKKLSESQDSARQKSFFNVSGYLSDRVQTSSVEISGFNNAEGDGAQYQEIQMSLKGEIQTLKTKIKQLESSNQKLKYEMEKLKQEIEKGKQEGLTNIQANKKLKQQAGEKQSNLQKHLDSLFNQVSSLKMANVNLSEQIKNGQEKTNGQRRELYDEISGLKQGLENQRLFYQNKLIHLTESSHQKLIHQQNAFLTLQAQLNLTKHQLLATSNQLQTQQIQKVQIQSKLQHLQALNAISSSEITLNNQLTQQNQVKNTLIQKLKQALNQKDFQIKQKNQKLQNITSQLQHKHHQILQKNTQIELNSSNTHQITSQLYQSQSTINKLIHQNQQLHFKLSDLTQQSSHLLSELSVAKAILQQKNIQVDQIKQIVQQSYTQLSAKSLIIAQLQSTVKRNHSKFNLNQFNHVNNNETQKYGNSEVATNLSPEQKATIDLLENSFSCFLHFFESNTKIPESLPLNEAIQTELESVESNQTDIQTGLVDQKDKIVKKRIQNNIEQMLQLKFKQLRKSFVSAEKRSRQVIYQHKIQIERLNLQLQTVRKQYEQVKSSEIALQHEYKENQNDKVELTRENFKLVQLLDGMNQKIQELLANYTNLQVKYNRLKLQLKQKQASHASLLTEYTLLQSKYNHRQHEQAQIITKYNQILNKYDQLSKSHLQVLNLSSRDKLVNDLQRKVVQKSNEIFKFLTQLKQQHQKIILQQKQISRVQQAYHLKQLQLNFKNTIVNEQSTTIASLEESIEHKDKIINQNSITIQNLNQSLQNTIKQSFLQVSSLSEAQNKLKQTQCKLSQTQSELAKFSQRTSLAQCQLEQKSLELTQSLSKLSEVQQSLKQNSSKLLQALFNISQKQQTLNNQQSQLQQAQSKLKFTMQQLECSKIQISKTNEIMEKNDLNLNQLNRTIGQLKIQVQTLQNVLSNQQASLVEINEKMAERNNQISKLTQSNAQYIRKNQSLLTELNHLKSQLQLLTLSKEQLQQSYNLKLQLLNQSHITQIQSVTNLHASQLKQQQEQSLTQHAQINSKFICLEQQLKDKTQLLLQEKQKTQTLSNQIAQQAQQVQQNNQIILQLQSQLQNKINESVSFDEKTKSKDLQLQSINQKLIQLTSRVESTQTQKQQQLQSTHHQILLLKQQLIKSQSIILENEAKLQEIQQKLESIQKQNQTQMISNANLIQQLQKNLEMINQLNKTISNLTEQKEQKENQQTKQLNDKIQTLNTKLSIITIQKDQLKVSNDQLKLQKDQICFSKNQIQLKLQQLTVSTKEQISGNLSKISRLNSGLESISREKQLLTSELDQTKLVLQCMQQAAQMKCKQTKKDEDRIARCQNEIEKLKLIIQSLEKICASNEQAIKNYIEEIQTLNRTISQHKQKVQQSKTINQNLKQSLIADYNILLEQKESQINQLNLENDQSKQQIIKFQSDKDEQLNKKNKLLEEIQSKHCLKVQQLNLQLTQLSSRLQDSQKTITIQQSSIIQLADKIDQIRLTHSQQSLSKDSQISEQQKSIKLLETNINQCQSRFQQLTLQIGQNNSKITLIQQSSKDNIRTIEQLKKQNIEKQQIISDLKKQLQHIDVNYQSLIQSSQKQRLSFEENELRLKNKIQELMDKNHDLAEECDSTTNQLIKLKQSQHKIVLDTTNPNNVVIINQPHQHPKKSNQEKQSRLINIQIQTELPQTQNQHQSNNKMINQTIRGFIEDCLNSKGQQFANKYKPVYEILLEQLTSNPFINQTSLCLPLTSIHSVINQITQFLETQNEANLKETERLKQHFREAERILNSNRSSNSHQNITSSHFPMTTSVHLFNSNTYLESPNTDIIKQLNIQSREQSIDIENHFDENISEVQKYDLKELHSSSSREILKINNVLQFTSQGFTPKLEKFQLQYRPEIIQKNKGQDDIELFQAKSSSKRHNLIFAESLSEAASQSQNEDVMDFGSRQGSQISMKNKSQLSMKVSPKLSLQGFKSSKNIQGSQVSESISKSVKSVMTLKESESKHQQYINNTKLKMKLKRKKVQTFQNSKQN